MDVILKDMIPIWQGANRGCLEAHGFITDRGLHGSRIQEVEAIFSIVNLIDH
jgi:hypothetical protein